MQQQEIQEKLEHQVGLWRKKLLDLGNRNTLINCSFNPSRGCVEILHPESELVWRKLAADSEAGADPMRLPWKKELVPPESSEHESESDGGTDNNGPRIPEDRIIRVESCLESSVLRDIDLITELSDKALNRRMRTLENYGRLSLSEQGVHSLYVAFGFLRWYESADSEIEIFSPLMLVPITLSRFSADAPWEVVEAEDDAIDNLCLRQRLKQDFGLELPPLPEIDVLEEPGTREAFLERVRQAILENNRWCVVDRCAIGRFAFPKIAMWKDLGAHSNELVNHAMCRSIAGDSSVSPSAAFGSTDGLPRSSALDDLIQPGEVKAILDCDSSQLEALVAARSGISFVLDGPPGTGKSQTIANIIADALGAGRTVLFVSEKVSALEVVKRRLDECGLGDFCLECHSSKANRKAVLDELGWCLEIPVEVYDDATPRINEIKQCRDSLNHYVRCLHQPREPHGLSPYELIGRVASLKRHGMAARTRCAIPDTAVVDRTTLNQWTRLFDRARDFAAVISAYHDHPWNGCKLTSRSLSLDDDIQHHFGILAKTFASIESATRPLVELKLIPEISASGINSINQVLKKGLAAPSVPRTVIEQPIESCRSIRQIELSNKTIVDLYAESGACVGSRTHRFSWTKNSEPWHCARAMYALQR